MPRAIKVGRRPILGLALSVSVVTTGLWLGSGLGAAQSARPAPLPQGSPTAAASAARRIDYNWDVRPILSENCFQCHGPDEKAARAGLRLDTAGRRHAELKPAARARHAIVPGSPDESELIKRVTHADGRRCGCRRRRRTRRSRRSRSTSLQRWIAQGAQYKPHWSFIPPARPVPPARARRLAVLHRHRSLRPRPAAARRRCRSRPRRTRRR